MKKLLLSLLTSCLVFSSSIVNLHAEETITKEYLKETLNMSDEEIIGAGLSYVYQPGDVITLPLTANGNIASGSTADNFTIPDKTRWEMEFTVVGRTSDMSGTMTVVSKDALPIGKVSLDDGTNANGIDFDSNWIHTFLNEKIKGMFAPSVQNKMVEYYRQAYQITNDGSNLVDIKDVQSNALPETNNKYYVWLPSSKELGYGNSYTINEGATSNYTLPSVGKVIYPEFASTPKANTVNCNGQQANYWLRESFYTNGNPYFLCTGSEGVTHANRNTAKNAVVIGITFKWSKDIENGVAITSEPNQSSNEVMVNAYTPATYEVSLPESITLTKDFTQFTYTVSGDLEKNNKVKVDFDDTALLKFNGGFTKDDIVLNVFNEKVTYNRSECAKETTTIVTIKNEIPSAGEWVGSLPLTISFE